MPVLELISPHRTHRVSFNGVRFVFGRDEGCDATLLGDKLISRRHCEVVLYKGSYLVHDLKSRNGTLVAGKPIEAVKLVDRGVFQVGRTYVRFFLTPESAKAIPLAEYPKDATVPDPVPAASKAGGTDDIGLADDDDEPIYDVATLVDDDEDAIPIEGSASYNPSSPTLPEVAQPQPGDVLKSIGDMARMGRDPGFGIESMSLLNSRGQVVHEAGAALSDSTESLGHLQFVTLGALRSGASDIHLEPKQYDSLVRIRVDGAMLEVCRLTAEQNKRLISLIKVLCDIDITRKSIIQEGHFSLAVPGRTIDYRVSFAPAMYGQKMVIRVLDPAHAPQQLADLNMPQYIQDKLASTSQQSTGTVLVCGPTGSGKTTTLYAVLRQIDAGVRNVITIEDPIEYEIDHVTQIPVDTDEGHTFGNLLRTCLRQDPDVIVLGEIRDQDTAVTSMQAATTGHLVLSTVHSNDTISTVLRLLDLGVEPYLIASTLNVVLAQRLVRRLCRSCKKPTKPTEQDLKRLKKTADDDITIYSPSGCLECFNTGYAGRVGIFELLQATDALRDVILNKPNLVDLRNALADTDFKTLQEHAIERVLDGDTSLEDAHRTVGLD
ncbi:MAG: ATPase, T2SS/T4P/T4SS family [Planctomycetota bacterium]